MADFFAVRIEEEELWGSLQQLIAKVQLPTPMQQIERIKQIAGVSTSPTDFIDRVKAENLWQALKTLFTKF
jgi:hypothetical protein